MDSGNPNISSKVIDQPPDAVTDSKMECPINREHKYKTRISEDVEFSPGALTGEIEEVYKENASIVVSAVESDTQQRDSTSIDQCPKIESEFRGYHALTIQNQDSMTENVEPGQAGHLDQSSYFVSGPMHIETENENFVEATAAVSIEPVLKEAQNDPEAFQHRGIPRRLQFEDARHTGISNQPAQSPSHSSHPKSTLETPLTPLKGKQADAMQPLYSRNMNTTIKVPKPKGIGLHLNSIVNAVQAGSGAIVHVKSAQRGNISIRGKKPTPIINSHLSESSISPSVFTTAEDASVSMDENRHGSHASLAINSVTSLSCDIDKSSNNSIILNPVDDQSTPGNKRMYIDIETDDSSKEFKSSPKKKRIKSSDSSDADGCKRCNCKKSRCLKLYCDCFAAGMYCAESCSCQGCYNRPEYVDTVLETRQQIESRNPLAFAPKIVQNIIKPPASSRGEDGNHFTPSSARHKRGCNCKKSMCLKKYCECYQANVGCSDGCRCEGCKNVFGQKGENGMDKDVLSREGTNEGTDGSFVQKLMLSENGGLCHSELSNPHSLTPITPAVQLSNHRKDASKAWLHCGRYFQSPESSLTSVTPYTMTPGSPRNSDNNSMISETAGEILDLVSPNQELYYGNAETLDEFSTALHAPAKTGNRSGFPHPQEWASNLKAQSFPGNSHYSSVSSLSWRGSPNTPMAPFSASKPLKAVDPDGELSNNLQDDTPDILKDSSTSVNAVKVSSPNKKRISPPHAPQHQSSSSSLHGLRTGRKFILKAVPSFQPLTPCIDSKSIVAQQTNDPQNGTSNK